MIPHPLAILFWLLFFATALSAFVTVLAKNLLHAALALAMSLLGVAGLFLLLHADFLAAVQLVIYVGGITVLIIFAVVLSADSFRREIPTDKRRFRLGALVSVAVFYFVIQEIVALTPRIQNAPEVFKPTTAAIGALLLGKFVLPFEAISVLLVATMVGAIMILRKELE